MKSKLLLALLAVTLTGVANAQVKPEDAIKLRQSGYGFMAWNMGRIKSNVEGTYNKEEVIKAATAIQAIANSGMGALYPAGYRQRYGLGKDPRQAGILHQEGKRGQGCGGVQQGSQRNGQSRRWR